MSLDSPTRKSSRIVTLGLGALLVTEPACVNSNVIFDQRMEAGARVLEEKTNAACKVREDILQCSSQSATMTCKVSRPQGDSAFCDVNIPNPENAIIIRDRMRQEGIHCNGDPIRVFIEENKPVKVISC